MSKPIHHRRDGGGHALRGRRRGEKVRLFLRLPRKQKRVKPTTGRVEIEKVLLYSSGDE